MRRDRPGNRAADLLEVTSSADRIDGRDAICLHTDVRIGKADVDQPAGVLVLKRAIIQLDLDGAEIVPGKRHADPLRAPYTQEVENQVMQTYKSGGSLSGALGAKKAAEIDASASFKINAEAEQQVKREIRSKQVIEINAVKARGGNRWEIFDGGNDLEQTYIIADEPLCTIAKLTGANRISINVLGIIPRRDIEFRPAGRLKLFNKKTILNAFFASRLGQDYSPDDSKLIVSEQEIADD